MAENDTGFLRLTQIYSLPSIYATLGKFSMSQIINYFIEAIAADSKSKQDFKALRESSFSMFKAGHVQDIHLKTGYNTIIIVATCLPEMRKDIVYKMMIRLKASSADIQFANCGCLAGKGPRASCKHIASLCYALEDFVRVFMGSSGPEGLSCTDRLMEWNRPRERKLSPKKLSEIDFSVAKRETRKRVCYLQGQFSEDDDLVTQSDLDALNLFKTDLKNYQTSHPEIKMGMLTVLSQDQQTCNGASISQPPINDCSSNLSTCRAACSRVQKWIEFKANLTVSGTKRQEIFSTTNKQSDDEKWFEVRKGRITGSVCGRILNSSHIFPRSILTFILCSKVTTAAMQMGKEYEKQLLVRYKNHTLTLTGKEVTLEPAGFLIHPEKGWLGASPDAVVVQADGSKGCIEVKTAVSCWNSTIPDAARKSSFCLKSNEAGTMGLKQNHIYYHQCQLQLYVGSDMFSFCDFVIATSKDIFVQRIGKDHKWVKENIPKLEDFYDSFLLKRFTES